MKVELKNLHTIVMFIGISGSGKSTKAKQLDELAKKKGLRSVILSSDDCRHELLLADNDDHYHHHDIEMFHISDKAFDLLEKKMELYLKWPYNPNLLILDMMNLRTEDRQKIIEMARNYCYDIICIVLDYSSIDEYFLGLDEKYGKKLISRQLHKFHRDALPELGSKRYNGVIRVRNKTEPIELECFFNVNIDDVNLPNDKHDFIVADMHECLESFKELLKKVGFNIEKVVEKNIGKDNGKNSGKEIERLTGREDTRIIMAGDSIDKGNKTKETIEFLYNNIDRILFVWGGHESFVYRYLNGNIKSDNIGKDGLANYSSIPVLEKDGELKQKFFAICDKMKPFYQAKHFIVTHVGCENKFLGKTQEFAIRAQRYCHVDRFDDSVDDEIWLVNRREELKYLKEDAEACHQFHIFGHEPWRNNLIYKNKIHLDTGCVMGGRLTGILVDKWTGDYKLYHVNCLDKVVGVVETAGEIAVVAKEKLRDFTFEGPKLELEDRDYNRLIRCVKNKINFVSGTMCPADKRGDELEDINDALDYYKHKGIDKVMLQIKYMGSRCNIYLFDEVEKSYAVSRNGFLVRNPGVQNGLTNIYVKLRERFSDYFKENNLDMMILDGELMPWSALGEGLIDSTFQAINKGVRSELGLLKNSGFEEQFTRLKKQYEDSQFDSDRYKMKKEDLYNKYGPQKYESYKLLSDFYMPDVAELEILHDLYSKQLDIYAKQFSQEELNRQLHYEPFSILKSVKKNGDEIYYFDSDNETLFKMVNDAEYAICDLTPGGYEKARLFFDRITNQLNLEGIVIKPLKVDPDHGAPFIKVRSPSYLTIIYGYDYLNKVKYRNLINQKHIRRKLDTSIKEWQLGKKLLKVRYRDISENNQQYMNLLTRMIIETNSEESIDPRL